MHIQACLMKVAQVHSHERNTTEPAVELLFIVMKTSDCLRIATDVAGMN